MVADAAVGDERALVILVVPVRISFGTKRSTELLKSSAHQVHTPEESEREDIVEEEWEFELERVVDPKKV
jgi:hypothetical protein